ncbi:MAG TPA: hypothetical protein VFY68_16115 [Nitrososphaeraceae archaeon]|nr:hypothetical protein [Nitrososphaeraceae archaeon]
MVAELSLELKPTVNVQLIGLTIITRCPDPLLAVLAGISTTIGLLNT